MLDAREQPPLSREGGARTRTGGFTIHYWHCPTLVCSPNPTTSFSSQFILKIMFSSLVMSKMWLNSRGGEQLSGRFPCHVDTSLTACFAAFLCGGALCKKRCMALATVTRTSVLHQRQFAPKPTLIHHNTKSCMSLIGLGTCSWAHLFWRALQIFLRGSICLCCPGCQGPQRRLKCEVATAKRYSVLLVAMTVALRPIFPQATAAHQRNRGHWSDD